jgi:hypothetical protein
MDEVTEILLNGKSVTEFIALYIAGTIGALWFFLQNLYDGITKDPTTPMIFSWRYFVRGLIRVVLALTGLAFVILYFEELSPHLFELPNGTTAGLKVHTALFIGLGIDGLVKKMISAGIDGAKATEKALKKK